MEEVIRRTRKVDYPQPLECVLAHPDVFVCVWPGASRNLDIFSSDPGH